MNWDDHEKVLAFINPLFIQGATTKILSNMNDILLHHKLLWIF